MAGLLLPGGLTASENFTHNFRFGQSALGMAGAVVGMIQEPEATYYNPAGLGFLTGTVFSGTLQWYSYDQRDLKGGLDFPDKTGVAEDLTHSTFNVLPTSAVLTRSFDNDKHTIAFSTFLGFNHDHFQNVQTGYSTDDSGTKSQYRYYTIRQSRDDFFWVGPSYAYRPDNQFSYGVSVFLVQHSSQFQFRKGESRRLLNSDTDVTYQDYTGSADTSDYNLRAILGWMWRPWSDLSFGISILTAGIDFYGYGSLTAISLVSRDGGQVGREAAYQILLEEDLKARTKYPWTYRLGGSYQDGKFLYTISLSFAWKQIYYPVEYSRTELADKMIGYPYERRWQPTWQVAAGLEWLGFSKWPLRFGLFFKPDNSPAIGENPTMPMQPHIDIFGLTTSFGYQQDGPAVNIGLEVSGGKGHDVIFSGSGLEKSYTRVDRSQFQVVLFFFGAMDFARHEAVDVIKDIREESRFFLGPQGPPEIDPGIGPPETPDSQIPRPPTKGDTK